MLDGFWPFGTPLERHLLADETLYPTRCLPVAPDAMDRAMFSAEQKRRDESKQGQNSQDADRDHADPEQGVSHTTHGLPREQPAAV
jgi:hypothetical protein